MSNVSEGGIMPSYNAAHRRSELCSQISNHRSLTITLLIKSKHDLFQAPLKLQLPCADIVESRNLTNTGTECNKWLCKIIQYRHSWTRLANRLHWSTTEFVQTWSRISTDITCHYWMGFTLWNINNTSQWLESKRFTPCRVSTWVTISKCQTGLRPKVKVKQRCWKECREQDGCISIQCAAFSHKALIRSWVMLMARSCFMSAPLSLSLSQLHFTWREALHRELPLKSTNHQPAILKCWAITYLIIVISDSFSCQSTVSVTSVVLNLICLKGCTRVFCAFLTANIL